jgi:hypothetical protein
MVTGPSALWLEEFPNLFNKRFVILEYAPVSGVSVEDDFCIRQTPGQIDRITAGHHYIVLTVCYEDRLSNARRGIVQMALASAQMHSERRNLAPPPKACSQ